MHIDEMIISTPIIIVLVAKIWLSWKYACWDRFMASL